MAYGPKNIRQVVGESKPLISKQQERAPLTSPSKPTDVSDGITPIVTASRDQETPLQDNTSPVQAFGTKAQNLANYPNDVVRLDLFNAVDAYLGTNYRVPDFTVETYK